ncbi:MAG TPA: hypothetical protein VN826_01150 [Candidatus Eisenbacteria bacterium]|jgi:hypothetical protein|nr:hypothetical protein [Candidatus Eisenbacteria bacterium]
MRRIALGILLLCSVSFLVGGCAVSPQITNTPRSSIEQELLVSSLERGFETLETQHLAGATVTVDFYGLTPDKDFAKEFLIAWLQAHQVHIVNDPKEAQLRVKVFAPVLGVDQAQSFIGTPSFTVPFLGVTIPEIPLFRDVRHVGHAALESYTLEEDGGKFLDRSPTAMGQSTYDDYTVLIIIHFTRSDMEKSKWDWTAF